MQFPILVYRCPGPHQGRDGGKSYNFKQAVDKPAYDALLADGWHGTYAEASSLVEKEDQPEAQDAIAAPTRSELEQKARELGIKFDGRTRDAKLAALIAAHVEG